MPSVFRGSASRRWLPAFPLCPPSASLSSQPELSATSPAGPAAGARSRRHRRCHLPCGEKFAVTANVLISGLATRHRPSAPLPPPSVAHATPPPSAWCRQCLNHVAAGGCCHTPWRRRPCLAASPKCRSRKQEPFEVSSYCRTGVGCNGQKVPPACLQVS